MATAVLSDFSVCRQHALDHLDAVGGLFALMDGDSMATIDWEHRTVLPLMPADIQRALRHGATDDQLWHATAALHAVAYHLRGQHDLIRAAEQGAKSAKTSKPTMMKRVAVHLDAFSYRPRPALHGQLPVPGALENCVPKQLGIIDTHAVTTTAAATTTALLPPPAPAAISAVEPQNPMEADTPVSPVLGQQQMEPAETLPPKEEAEEVEEEQAAEEEDDEKSEAIAEDEERSEDGAEDLARLDEELRQADALAEAESKATKYTVEADDRDLPTDKILGSRLRTRRPAAVNQMQEIEAMLRTEHDDKEEDYDPDEGSSSSDAAAAVSEQSSESEIDDISEAETSSSSEEEEAPVVVKKEPKAKKEPVAIKKEPVAAPPAPVPMNGAPKATTTTKRPRSEADRMAESVTAVMGSTVQLAQREASKVTTSVPKPKKQKPEPASKPATLAERLQYAMTLLTPHNLRPDGTTSYLGRLCTAGATKTEKEQADMALFMSCFYRDKRDAYRSKNSNELDKLAHAYRDRVRAGANQILQDMVEVALQTKARLQRTRLSADAAQGAVCQVDGRSPATFQLRIDGQYPQSDAEYHTELLCSEAAGRRLQAVYFAAHVCEEHVRAITEYQQQELELPQFQQGLQYVDGYLKSAQAARFQRQWCATHAELSV